MKNLTAIIRKGEKFYIAECLEIDVVTQGKTIDEALANLKEAVHLYFENEDTKDLPLSSEPPIAVPIIID